MDWLSRTKLLLTDESVEKLKQSHVLVVGLGGVGGYAAEMICRAGVGKMTIVDGDFVNATNRNRQLIALMSNEGMSKARVMGDRLLDINSDLELEVIADFVKNEKIVELLENNYDYVVDAIDTLSPKCFLLKHCVDRGLKVVSSMGAGGKMDPTKVEVCDISKSHSDRLASAVRKRLSRLEIRKGITVVFSSEMVDKSAIVFTEGEEHKLTTVGTVSYMPPIFGIFCSSVVIKHLADYGKDQ